MLFGQVDSQMPFSVTTYVGVIGEYTVRALADTRIYNRDSRSSIEKWLHGYAMQLWCPCLHFIICLPASRFSSRLLLCRPCCSTVDRQTHFSI